VIVDTVHVPELTPVPIDPAIDKDKCLVSYLFFADLGLTSSVRPSARYGAYVFESKSRHFALSATATRTHHKSLSFATRDGQRRSVQL
jgi:hypothetical protein